MTCALVVWLLATTFDVDVQGSAWQVEALRATLPVDLASDQLKPAPRGELHVAVVVGEAITYTLSRDGVAPVRGTVPRGADRRAMAGVIKDELLRLVPHENAVDSEDVAVPAARLSAGALGALAACVLVLLAPIVLARRRIRAPVGSSKAEGGAGGTAARDPTSPPASVPARASTSPPAAASTSPPAAASPDKPVDLPRIHLRSTGRLVAGALLVVGAGVAIAFDMLAPSALFVVGGLAWGFAIAVCIPLALPLVAGLHRVEHRELGVVLRAWSVLAIVRLVIVTVGLATVLALLWLVGAALDLPVLVTFGVIAPFVVLGIRLVWRAAVEIRAARLDARLVENDDWHAQVHGYLVGYLRRANLDVDDELLARMRFLAGKEPERVAVYGGGYTHTRVVIGRAMLERALAPYGRPHDYAMPRVSTLHWTHWNAGLVMPTASDEKLATRDDRDPGKSAHASAEVAEHERLALGEPPTLTGIIEPVQFDPRKTYRPDEDPLWLDWDPGEEHDGTDAGDKDFLFGVLVSALGIAQRHEDRAATFVVDKPRLVRALTAHPLADIAAVLAGARHHLAQYLAWQLWQREDLITARAYVPQLEQKSRGIVAALDKAADEDEPARPRLLRLRRFIDPRGIIKRSQRQRLAIAIAVLAACAAVAALAVQAALYHSTYEERHHRDGKRS